jgi:phenylacetate-CoA ligase
LACADARVRGVRHPQNRGIAPAWRSGLQAARGSLICLIDADLQNRPEDIARLYHAYTDGGADVVQGVRRPVCTLHRHRLFTSGLNALLNVAFRTRLKDNKSGFLLCAREALAVILQHRFTYRYFQAFVGVAAAARRLSIKEIDTTFDPRRNGVSFLARFPIRASLRIVWELLKFRTEVCLDVLRPSAAKSPGRRRTYDQLAKCP